MRYLFRIFVLIALLSSVGAYAHNEVLSGTADVSDAVWFPEGVGGFLISGDFDNATCTIHFIGEDTNEYDFASYSDDSADIPGSIVHNTGIWVFVRCLTADTDMGVYVQYAPLRVRVGGEWVYPDPVTLP